MRSFFATLQQLVIPAGAGPNSPAIIIGPTVPAEVAAWAAFWGPATVTIDEAIVFRRSATSYVWEAIGTFSGVPARMRGTYDPANGVILTQRTVITGAGVISERFGSGLNPITIQVDMTNADFTIASVSQGRGQTGWASSVVASAAVAGETVVLTSNVAAFQAGRAYSAEFVGETGGSVASNTALYLFRRNGVAGTILRNAMGYTMSATVGVTLSCAARAVFANYTAVGVVDTVVLTLQSSAGTVTMDGQATRPRHFEVRDIGAAVDYPNVPQI